MAQNTLVNEYIQLGVIIARQVERGGGQLHAVFWGLRDDDSQWTLYFVSGLVETQGLQKTYAQFAKSLNAAKAHRHLRPTQVEILAPSHSVSQVIIQALKAPGVIFPLFLTERDLHGEFVSAYVYDPALYSIQTDPKMMSEEINIELLRRLQLPADSYKAVNLTLIDCSRLTGEPISLSNVVGRPILMLQLKPGYAAVNMEDIACVN